MSTIDRVFVIKEIMNDSKAQTKRVLFMHFKQAYTEPCSDTTYTVQWMKETPENFIGLLKITLNETKSKYTTLFNIILDKASKTIGIRTEVLKFTHKNVLYWLIK